ncbi:unnamed protein product [Phytomonas sp. EM1]|nr:unnamed protein product [Phytomonas sp. EM1]|eukprot:CCW62099.1 unnamed protein product [Phytomonas sp. isolate EM1]
MESEELSALRTELLRQKVVFAAELRRQREEFEERLDGISQALAERDADCRNLQTVVTILGKKMDLFSKQLHEHKTRATPLRRSVSNRRASLNHFVESAATSVGLTHGDGGRSAKKSGSELVSTPEEEPRRSHALLGNPSNNNPPDSLRLNLISSLKSLSRTSSPFNEFHSREDSGAAIVSARGVNQRRPFTVTPTKTSPARAETTRQADKRYLLGSESQRNTTRSCTRRKVGPFGLGSSKGSTKS